MTLERRQQYVPDVSITTKRIGTIFLEGLEVAKQQQHQ